MKLTAECRLMAVLMCCGVTASCGGKRGGGDSGPARGKIASAFYEASAESGVPVRMLFAAAYLESGLRAQQQSVVYGQQGRTQPTMIAFGDSAFGLSLKELGLENDPTAVSNIVVQAKAYGRLLKERLANTAVPPNAVTPEEKLRWIWQLAEIHRSSDSRNLWAIFSLEMMDVLNTGFEVSDMESSEIITLEKEPVAIKEEQLPANYQQDLNLVTSRGNIRAADLFSLTDLQSPDVLNVPKRIEVIHCPLSLSACVNLQTKDPDNYAPLGTHYIVSNLSAVGGRIIQVARHDEAVMLVNADGVTETVTDRIVIMTTGFSGRYTRGVRSFVNPMWADDSQLRLLGLAVSEICDVLAERHGISLETCVSPGVPNGVAFRRPGPTYRWGDVADFDEAVFYPYISSGGAGILASTAMEVEGNAAVVDAGASFKLKVQFQGSAKRVEIERLVRCEGEGRRVVWESVHNQPVRNITSYSFVTSLYDAGPNGNGDQFFRAKVAGESGKFLGWSMRQVRLKNFEQHSEGTVNACLRD